MQVLSKKYIVVLVIVFLGTLFHYRYINEFPTYIHAWSQSDHYALSIGFVNNGLNFFKPQTFIMNRQLDDGRNVPTDNVITAVDFPLHDYLPAVAMKIIGSTAPYIFRVYILLYSFIGLWFLYKLVYEYSNDHLKSLFIVIFTATSPVFVYYQGGFIPSIPSISNSIMGIYFYLCYLRQNSKTDLWFTIFFLTLATLCRTTFAVTLFAFFGVQLLRIVKKQDS